MKKWIFKLDFSTFYNSKELTIVEKASKCIKHLLLLKNYFRNEGEFSDIISEFENVEDSESFDNVMKHLNGYANFWHIWIEI